MANEKKTRGHKSSPITGENRLMLQPGDNTKYLGFAFEISMLPKIDTADIEQVQNRINEYFNLCIKHDTKPAVTGLALALGTDRRNLWRWKEGSCRKNTHSDVIKKAYTIMEVMWEEYMLNGKINPVCGIFLGKNHWGYQDQSEIVVTPNNPLGDGELDAAELKQKYLEDVKDDIEE